MNAFELRAGVTFVVRVSRDEAGRVRGVVERVRTGHKERFDGLDDIAAIIRRLLEGDGREG
jgi:hypothetical protein